jgi:phytoene desaturase
MKKVKVIGAGFAGMSAATCLADKGFEVTVVEKNNMPGGRARKFSSDGFVFDMGPTWYWMPDVFEKYFNRFGKKPNDYYELERLDPSYRIYYGNNDFLDIPACLEKLIRLFEQLEPGSGKKLKFFLQEGKRKYEIGVNELVYQPGLNWSELFRWEVIKSASHLHIFSSVSNQIRKNFKNQRIIQLLEFPVLFLGSTPQRTPALYTLMNYADMVLGTWYPKGGMHKVVEGMESLAKEKGVNFLYDSPVNKINFKNNQIESLRVADKNIATDFVIASADYHHVEQEILPSSYRKYNTDYWNSRMLAPSALLFFLGVNKKINGLCHHTLFFDEDFALHAQEIYDRPQWPTSPQFYISCPSKSDPAVAPEGCENLMILVPVAAGLVDTNETREKYFKVIVSRLETILGEAILPNIIFKRSYAHNDFISDYNSLKGNAYGLANTLLQTANLKPSIVNPKVENLVYTGQLTVPGPGVPPAIISGQVSAQLVIDKTKSKTNRR